MSTKQPELESLVARKYRHGFVTDIASDTVAPGLDEDVIHLISAKKGEPAFMLDWRLKAFRRWSRMTEPAWAQVRYPPIDFQAISYYSAPKQDKDGPKSLADVDPKLLETYDKLGIPLHERARLAGVAVDAVFDSQFELQHGASRVEPCRRFKRRDGLFLTGPPLQEHIKLVQKPGFVRKIGNGGAQRSFRIVEPFRTDQRRGKVESCRCRSRVDGNGAAQRRDPIVEIAEHLRGVAQVVPAFKVVRCMRHDIPIRCSRFGKKFVIRGQKN